MLRALGQWVGKIKGMASDFQGQFQEAMREAEVADLKKQFDEASSAATNFTSGIDNPLESAKNQIESTFKDATAMPTPDTSADSGRPLPISRRRRTCLRLMPRPKWRSRDCETRRRRVTEHAKDEEAIEATKAPLIEHLIELRSRLIKAMIAFAIAFAFCFFFAKQIYNILVWPFVLVAGPENSKFIYTALLEYFLTQLKLAMFGAVFLAFPVIAAQIYMFVAPGLYRNEKQAFLPYLIATPFFFTLGASMVYFLVMPLLVRFSIGMQQTGIEGQADIALLPKVGEYLSLMMSLVLAFGIAFQLPVILTLARPRRHPDLGTASRQAPLFHRGRLHHRGGADAAGRDQPALARGAAVILYEGSIWSVRLVEKKAAASKAASASTPSDGANQPAE